MGRILPLDAKRLAHIRKQIKAAHHIGPTYSIPAGPSLDQRYNAVPPKRK